MKHHETPKLNESAGIHIGVLGQLRSVRVSDIPFAKSLMMSDVSPTYPNTSWIQLDPLFGFRFSDGFRYPEYQPNVEHFMEVLEPFFSITVEEAGSSGHRVMFQAPLRFLGIHLATIPMIRR